MLNFRCIFQIHFRLLRFETFRIVNVYTNLLFEEVLEDGQSVSNNTTSGQNDEIGLANIKQQLTSVTVSPELNANGNQISDQIIISIPPNQIPTAPLKKELHASSGEMERSEINGMENGKPLIEFNPIKDNEMPNVSTETKAVGSIPTNRNGPILDHPQIIDLILDLEGEADILDIGRTLDAPIQPHIRRENVYEARDDNGTPYKMQIDQDTYQPILNVLEETNIQPAIASRTNIESNSQERTNNRIANLGPVGNKQRQNNGGDSVGGQELTATVYTYTAHRHKCDFCEFSTEYKTSIARHIRLHTNERPYECKICKKRFNQKSNLNIHTKTHRNSFEFECSKCHQGFSYKRAWKLHKNRCIVKQFECYLCKRFFTRKHKLIFHMRAHACALARSCVV